MKISIVCVGKIKESFYRQAVEEYAKRLSKYCKLEVIEVADEKTPDKASEGLESQIKEKEAAIAFTVSPGSTTYISIESTFRIFLILYADMCANILQKSFRHHL